MERIFEKHRLTDGRKESRTDNSTFAIGGVSRSEYSLRLGESLYLRMSICAGEPAHRKCANR
jgi:hypothetical protein